MPTIEHDRALSRNRRALARTNELIQRHRDLKARIEASLEKYADILPQA